MANRYRIGLEVTGIALGYRGRSLDISYVNSKVLVVV